LVVLSAAGSVDITNYTGSVSAISFIQTWQALSPHFNVAIATPNGSVPEFHYSVDKVSEKWMKDNRHLVAHPLSISDLNKSENVLAYAGLVFPSSLGGVSDLANDVSLGVLVKKFVSNKKPICAIGYGVAGLCKAFNENDRWCFSGWNLTAISNFEVARYPFFSKLPLIIEDYIKDHGGYYNCSSVDEVHVIVDRNLITGQNDESTTLAVKNFAWLAAEGQIQGKEKGK